MVLLSNKEQKNWIWSGLLAIFAMILLAACQPRKPEFPYASAVQQNNSREVSKYLAEGGNANALSRFGDPLLYLSVGRQGGMEVARLLISAGADVNGMSRNGITVLSGAASWCNIEEVALLIDAGADVNLAGKNKATPLESVCGKPQKRRDEIISILKAAGAGKE